MSCDVFLLLLRCFGFVQSFGGTAGSVDSLRFPSPVVLRGTLIPRPRFRFSIPMMCFVAHRVYTSPSIIDIVSFHLRGHRVRLPIVYLCLHTTSQDILPSAKSLTTCLERDTSPEPNARSQPYTFHLPLSASGNKQPGSYIFKEHLAD